MKRWHEIASIILLIPFLFSTIGVLVYNSECTCTGSEHYSLYVTPNSCDTATNEIDRCCGSNEKEKSCTSCELEKACGCDDYKLQFVKIKSQFANEDISKLKAKTISILVTALLFNEDFTSEPDNSRLGYYYIDPPNKITGFEFLIQINQLKIPHIA